MHQSAALCGNGLTLSLPPQKKPFSLAKKTLPLQYEERVQLQSRITM